MPGNSKAAQESRRPSGGVDQDGGGVVAARAFVAHAPDLALASRARAAVERYECRARAARRVAQHGVEPQAVEMPARPVGIAQGIEPDRDGRFPRRNARAAGVKAGLPAELAMRLARATVSGAGELLHRAPESAEQLRKNVTSPKGTTQAALDVLMAEDGLAPLMEKAVRAARDRGRELAG